MWNDYIMFLAISYLELSLKKYIKIKSKIVYEKLTIICMLIGIRWFIIIMCILDSFSVNLPQLKTSSFYSVDWCFQCWPVKLGLWSQCPTLDAFIHALNKALIQRKNLTIIIDWKMLILATWSNAMRQYNTTGCLIAYVYGNN